MTGVLLYIVIVWALLTSILISMAIEANGQEGRNVSSVITCVAEPVAGCFLIGQSRI